MKILDGNALAATERRLRETRASTAGPLPGKALVVLEPELGLLSDVFCCEDGHAQERSLLPQVLGTVHRGDLWIADRNFSTAAFLFALEEKGAAFVIRRHAKLACQEAGELRFCGAVEGGEVFEQAVVVRDDAGRVLHLRQVVVHLEKPTREGERELRILTTLPAEVANALTVAELYRKRWRIEGAFHALSETLQSEIKTLAYPPAALLGFCVGLVSFNLFAVVKAALRSAYGEDVVEQEVSTYYLTDEVAGTHRGMRIAIAPAEWAVFHELGTEEMANLLWEWAGCIDLSLYRKSKRGPKKAKPPRQHDPKKPHVSTARLLAERRRKS
ncbi:MAG: transposase [Gemmatimonadetes bacterium]|nr:transposase [Gemmatimonadota bacterium]